MRKVKLFYKIVFTLNHYKGIDKLTFLDWMYRKRISIKDALTIAKILGG